MENTNLTTQKCYNSFSCIGAVLVILFVLGSIVWDICFTKPAIRESIEEIRIEVKDIHNKIDSRLTKDSISFKLALGLLVTTEDSVKSELSK